jgi:hypothetical protein
MAKRYSPEFKQQAIDYALSLFPRFCCRPDSRVSTALTRVVCSSLQRCIRHVSTQAILATSSFLKIA